MKKTILILVLAIILIGGFLLINNKNTKKENSPIPSVSKEPVSLCYLYAKKTDRGFYDKAWLRLNLNGEKVTGEFNNYLAEKDSKIGDFEGTVGPLDQKLMARTADVWWHTFGEGMKATEELLIQFGDGNASPGAGELIDRGDGVYVYKDKTKLFYNFSLNQIACEDLDEKLAVEKYVQDNIKTIATNKPALGGSWYVTAVFANYALDEGEVTYEDGHIQSKAIFQYDFDAQTKNVALKDFKIQ